MSDTTEESSSERDRGRRARGPRGDGIRDRSHDRVREPRSMKSSSNRVYVSNIPYEYRWQDVKDLFRTEVGDVQFVELFFDDNDKPRGSGIVEFSDPASVRKCVEVMQRFDVKGRRLVIKEDIGVMRDRHGVVVNGGSGGGGGGGRRNDRYRNDYHRENIVSLRSDDGKWSNTYGLSVQFLESLNIDPPIGNKVFVANLEYNIDKKKLKDAFRLAGKVVRVEIPVDKEGRSRGFAVVEYDHPVEAVQAISMFHNQMYFDRSITVRMDRASDTFRLPEGLKSVGMGLGPNGEPLRCVPHNLPSLNNSSLQQASSVSGGLLGANNLQLANALSGLSSVGSLGGINPQVLQAANLAGFGNNILGQGMGNTDLSSLAAAANSTTHLAAFSQNNSGNLSSGNSISNYSRSSGGGDYNSYGGQAAGNQGYNAGNNSGVSNRGYQNSNDFGNTLQFTNNSGNDRSDAKGFSRKVLVSNLPSTVSYKLLTDKFSEYGDIVAFEAKSSGSIVLTYGSDWQAERAIKNLDKARIDGRMIEARHYY